MSIQSVVGFAGNITRPSKTRSFVEHIVLEVAQAYDLVGSSFDIEDLGPSFPTARSAVDLDRQAAEVVTSMVEADLLVIGSPTYKGSYTGLFKHFFDLLDPTALRGKPIILAATGGGERHSLIVEHQLRPLFGFFEALTLPTAIYASDRDFEEGSLVSDAIRKRAAQSVREAGLALDRMGRTAGNAAA